MAGIDPDGYRNWTPAAQERALGLLQQRTNSNWRPFFCGNRTCDGKPHDKWTWNHGRGDQYPPTDADFLVWAITSGRGAGKTRTGAEVAHQMSEHVPRVAIVAATGADVRDTCLEGQSGLLTIARPDRRPKYEPSKRRLTWPNGCVGTTFSGEEPDRLRGPEHGWAWLDEPAHYPLIQAVWDNLLFGLRVGRHPWVLVTTTPRPRPWMKALLKDERTRHTVTSTYANLDNLAPTFAEQVIARFEGTRLGLQELHGQLLEDVEGALWSPEMIEADRVDLVPQLERVVVGVDPSGSRTGDEVGIVVVGRSPEKELYVLADYSGHYTPLGWARKVIEAYEFFSADAVVAERNFGGDMVAHTLRTESFEGRLLEVHARKGKALRAEPLVGMYEQHRCVAEGSLIETTDGPTPIEAVREGHHVHTRNGPRRVAWAGQTGVKQTVRLDLIDGRSLMLTADHPVWTENRGWVHGGCLVPSDILRAWPHDEVSASTAQPRSTARRADASRVRPVTAGRQAGNRSAHMSTSTKPATTSSRTATGVLHAMPVTSCCTGLFGVSPTGRSLTATPSTTSIMTSPTTPSGISPASPTPTTPGITTLTASTPQRSSEPVASVARRSAHRSSSPCSALVDAGWTTRLARPVTPGPILPVFDLTVEDAHEFFANGVLVHNCHHHGYHSELEVEMCEWVPYDKLAPSPNRIDALVYAGVPLMESFGKAQLSSPINLKRSTV